MRIGVCDDQKLYREEIINSCKKLLEDSSVIYECFSSGEEFLNADVECDFLFLDIEMEGIDGIQVKDKLESGATQTRIIFLTSHEERMIEAFGVNVIGFLKKPVCEGALEPIIKRMRDFLKRKMVVWKENGQEYAIPLERIRYVEAQDKYSFLVLKEEKYLVRRTLKEWEAILPQDEFCRVNRSYLVNLDIFDKTKGEVVLEYGKSIRLSRKNKADIEERYKRYLRKRMEEL